MDIIYSKPTKEQEAFKTLLTQHGFNTHHALALSLRGVNTLDEAKYTYKLTPPHLLKDVERLSDRLSDHILQGKKLSIVADYDCDGATSCSIAYLGLLLLGTKPENLNFMVPNRFKHGYGISQGVVDDLIATKGKPDCIITVDNGIAAHAGIDYCNSIGIEVLVTDHHLPIKDKENPKCYALVNPNQEGDTSGLKNMAGCGVIFYCLMETQKQLMKKGREKVDLLPLLDLVALGTIADVVKLDTNNRKLVKYGLGLIRQNKTTEGMKALFKVSGKQTPYANSLDFGFSIGPRLNAAGRLVDMTTGIQCLISNDPQQSLLHAQTLNDWNVNRKEIESQMKDVAYEKINLENQTGVTRVVYDPSYHEGVVGIVASRIKEEYNVPTIVFSDAEEEGCLKGSGRSIPQVHLRDALDLVFKEDETIFKGFGGHAMAAGLTIHAERLEDFKRIFEEKVRTIIAEPPQKEIIVDCQLQPNEITVDLALALQNEIWGQGFPAPTYVAKLKIAEVSHLHIKGTPQEDRTDETKLHTKYLFTNGVEGLHFFNVDNERQTGDEITVVFNLSVSFFRPESPQVSLTIRQIL